MRKTIITKYITEDDVQIVSKEIYGYITAASMRDEDHSQSLAKYRFVPDNTWGFGVPLTPFKIPYKTENVYLPAGGIFAYNDTGMWDFIKNHGLEMQKDFMEDICFAKVELDWLQLYNVRLQVGTCYYNSELIADNNSAFNLAKGVFLEGIEACALVDTIRIGNVNPRLGFVKKIMDGLNVSR